MQDLSATVVYWCHLSELQNFFNQPPTLQHEEITFCDVPWHTTKKDLAGVQRILVVSGRQLTTPGECSFIYSWQGPNKKKNNTIRPSSSKPLKLGILKTRQNSSSVWRCLMYLQPVCVGGPLFQYWMYHLSDQARLHQATERQCASGEKWLRRKDWHWMVGWEESWSPVGPDGSPGAADPSACLMWDKAGEGKSAKSTEEKTSDQTLLGSTCSFNLCLVHYCLKRHVGDIFTTLIHQNKVLTLSNDFHIYNYGT